MQIKELLVGLLVVAGCVLAAVGLFYLVARWVLVRIAERVSDRIAAQVEATRILGHADSARTADAQAARRLARTKRLATLMDAAVQLPIVGGVGLDALLGLFPVIGDAVTTSVGLKIIVDTLQYGLPKPVIAKMIGNLCADLLLGAVPVVGDLVDVAFKANVRNVALVEDYLRQRDGIEPRQQIPPRLGITERLRGGSNIDARWPRAW